MSEYADLYQDILLDHGRTPRNFRAIDPATHHAEGYNPLCGDRVNLTLQVSDGVIGDAAFTGQACAICTASASMMTAQIKGRSVEEADRLSSAFTNTLAGEEPADAEEVLGEAMALAGVRRFPMRVKCATLPWHTLREALHGDAPGK